MSAEADTFFRRRKYSNAFPARRGVSDFAVGRELFDYDQADTIAVLSMHCQESFTERGVAADKIVCNPLGVDLEMFPVTPVSKDLPPTIIMAGTWSLQKGCDTLVDAWRRLSGVHLVHVGSVGDCPLPSDSRFQHYSKVDQHKLTSFYSKAHVFALASRQEGLATVQPQAIASGLRLVCTSRTGGEDLIQYLKDASTISVVPPDDATALAESLNQSLADALDDSNDRNRLRPESRHELSWAGYAERYDALLRARLRETRCRVPHRVFYEQMSQLPHDHTQPIAKS